MYSAKIAICLLLALTVSSKPLQWPGEIRTFFYNHNELYELVESASDTVKDRLIKLGNQFLKVIDKDGNKNDSLLTGLALTALTLTSEYHSQPHVIHKQRLRRDVICELEGSFVGGDGGDGGRGGQNQPGGSGGRGGRGYAQGPAPGFVKPSDDITIPIKGSFRGGRGGRGGKGGGNGGDGGHGLIVAGVICDRFVLKGQGTRDYDGRDGRDGLPGPGYFGSAWGGFSGSDVFRLGVWDAVRDSIPALGDYLGREIPRIMLRSGGNRNGGNGKNGAVVHIKLDQPKTAIAKGSGGGSGWVRKANIRPRVRVGPPKVSVRYEMIGGADGTDGADA